MKDMIDAIKKQDLDKSGIAKLKLVLCQRYAIKDIPSDIEILMNASREDYHYLGKYMRLQTKPTRTMSGVAVCAIMTKPQRCPHGECTMCPSLTGSGVPQSYTGKEPATRRGIRNRFDPYRQVFNRLEQYVAMGQNPQKVELILMGGTFISFNRRYQNNYVAYALKAMNDFSKEFYPEFNIEKFRKFFMLPGDVESDKRAKAIRRKVDLLKGKAVLEAEKKRNENSKIRCVALCVETRPDFSKESHIDQMLGLGTTRVELGVQTIYDSVLKKINRGHMAKDSIEATALLKDSFLKVGYHAMIGLPGSDEKMDLTSLKDMVSNPDYMPDALKIYPCMVVADSRLHKDYKVGRFSPLNTDKAAEIISEFKRYIPDHVRVMRIQRDIPTQMIEAGVDRTNLRQYVEKLSLKKGIRCRCIRCRESGHVFKKTGIVPEKIDYLSKEYDASAGKEIFISAEDKKKDILLGYLRMRIPNEPFRKEITSLSAGIREIHVFGFPRPIEGTCQNNPSQQHKGIGKRLIKIAEKTAIERYDRKKMLVISGIGVRGYYRKLGYRKDGPYMSKRL